MNATAESAVRKSIWNLLCDLEWKFRYYSALANKYNILNRYIRILIPTGLIVIILMSFVLTGVDFIDLKFVFLWLGIMYVTVFASYLWYYVSNPGEHGFILTMNVCVADELRSDAEQLWLLYESNLISDADAIANIKDIQQKLLNSESYINTPVHDKLNNKCAAAANQEIISKYTGKTQ